MNSEKKLSELTDKELLQAAKKMKSSTITHALLIGCVFGITVYGVAKSNIGFFGLILLLFLAYKFFYNPENNKKNEELRKLLKERNLK
jgi:threonine/homoserine/homoserine lactone efflux protein